MIQKGDNKMPGLYRLSILLAALMLFGASAINVNASAWTNARAGLAPTTVIVEDPNDPSRPGERVEVYIHVTSPGGTPTGVVEITGADVNCRVTLEFGAGMCQVIFKTLQTRTITANYLGDFNFAPGSATAPHSMLRNKVFRSLGKLDGWILESYETSGVGGLVNANAATLTVGDDAADRQYRSILHFDTSSMPDDAVVAYAEIRIKRYGIGGQNPMASRALLADCKSGFYGGGDGLASHDFEAPSTPSAIPICGDFYGPSHGWFFTQIFPGAFTINLTGPVQFRLLFWLDDNDNRAADVVWFYSGNAAFEDRPQLIVWYSLP
jgi:hypothetical protein